MRARVAGKSVAFSVKEFTLLRFLLQSSPDTRSRRDILAEVWGSPEGAEVLFDGKPAGRLGSASPTAVSNDEVKTLA